MGSLEWLAIVRSLASVSAGLGPGGRYSQTNMDTPPMTSPAATARRERLRVTHKASAGAPRSKAVMVYQALSLDSAPNAPIATSGTLTTAPARTSAAVTRGAVRRAAGAAARSA